MLDIQNYIGKPKIIEEKVDDTTTRFDVQYLPRGFGHSFGNAIRRAILGYNYWWAVTWIKMKGVPHEYETIDGVKESALDIMLNFKELRFKVDENNEKLEWVSQRFKGVGKYSSKDLNLPSWIEELTESKYLFEITDPAVELIVDVRIEKGYWYYSIDYLRKRESKWEEQDIWVLLIDNDFKLVDYVTYSIEEHIDDFTGSSKDNLKIEVKTISSKVSARELLTFVGEVLSSYSKLFVFDESYIDSSMLVDYSDMEETGDVWGSNQSIWKSSDSSKTIPIDAIPLSERTRNALIKNEILYVEDLEQRRKSDLLSMKGVWRKAVDEISQALEDIWKSLVG